jgi:hypothetical protein
MQGYLIGRPLPIEDYDDIVDGARRQISALSRHKHDGPGRRRLRVVSSQLDFTKTAT